MSTQIYKLFSTDYLENIRCLMEGWQPSHVGLREFMIYRGPGPMKIYEMMDDGRVIDRTRGNVPKRFQKAQADCPICGDALHVVTYGDFYKVECPACNDGPQYVRLKNNRRWNE